MCWGRYDMSKNSHNRTDWKKVAERYNSVQGTRYKDDFDMFHELLDVFPAYFIAEMIGISYPTTLKRIRELGFEVGK